jgi:nicotinamide-nucleotide adenylyltransferase
MTSIPERLGRVGFIGRFKPLHLGGEALLEALCQRADEVVIGIGSANKYNARNPFTAQESEGMVRAALGKYNNYRFIDVPDFAHIPEYKDGLKWKEFVVDNFKVDYFIVGNEFVKGLLFDKFKTLDSYLLVPKDKRIKVKASEIRVAMATFQDWKKFVSGNVAKYLEDNGLVERFRKEFGLETLSLLASGKDIGKTESAEEELANAREKG